MEIQFRDCTLEISKMLNAWLTDEATKKYAMFDSTFDEEFTYYQSNTYEEQIKDVLKVIYVDGKLIGYVVFNYYAYEGIREVSINPLIIHPNYRNQGYGRYVLSYLVSNIEEIIEDKVTQIYATIEESNISSIKLFEHVGFHCTSLNENFRNYYFINHR